MNNPDWRKDADYGYTASLNNEGWAWEFLRRNPTYKNRYIEVRNIYDEGIKSFGPFNKNNAQWADYEPIKVYADDIDSHQLDGAWNGRIWDENLKPEWIFLEAHEAGLWGLKEKMSDPSKWKACPKFRFPYDHPTYITNTHSKYFTQPATPFSDLDEGQYIAIGFDLSLPIKKQIPKAHEILKDQRKARKIKQKRNSSSQQHWKNYLRVLDAIADNASDIQIASKIYAFSTEDGHYDPNVKSIYARKKSAKKLRDKDYIKIIRSALA